MNVYIGPKVGITNLINATTVKKGFILFGTNQCTRNNNCHKYATETNLEFITLLEKDNNDWISTDLLISLCAGAGVGALVSYMVKRKDKR